MTAPQSLMRALAAFDPNGWSLARGSRGALGCCLPLLAAQWYANPALSWAALIGFWVALVDPGWPPRSRLRTIGAFTVGSAFGCFIAVLLRPYVWPSGAFALVWCFGAILTRVWGDTAGTTGNLTALATLIVLGADQPSSVAAATEMAEFTIGGGLWGLLLAFAIGQRRPEAPLRDALAAVFRAEAAVVRDLAHAGPLPDRLHVPWFDCCVPEGTTTVAWAFSLPSSAGCRTSSVADKRQRIIDAFAGLRVQSTAWTNYYNMLTDTTHTEEWLVIPVTSALHKLSANWQNARIGAV
jgi:hypothetical protein